MPSVTRAVTTPHRADAPLDLPWSVLAVLGVSLLVARGVTGIGEALIMPATSAITGRNGEKPS